MPSRDATTRWQGDLMSGKGEVSLDSSNLGTYAVSFPTRASETADGQTSPEELVAAAHSACYAMQLSNLLATAGHPPTSLDVTAEVALGPDKAGGFAISGIALTLRGEAPGISAEDFQAKADEAKTQCPVSKALTGTTITLDATLG